MILVWIIAIPLAGGLLAWLLGRRDATWPRWISFIALSLDLALVMAFWLEYSGPGALSLRGRWLIELNYEWVPQLGISFHLAMDGLSLLLVMLTLFLGTISVVCSWTEIKERVGFFHFNLLWVLAGVAGVFLALDLFLFYFFWELMLVPMYFLIALWGHENRIYASVKFFIFTQLSGLLMLAAILGLFVIHGRQTGVYTFDYPQLLGTSIPPAAAFWLMLGFFAAFAVKLPAVPFHSWLPDAHTEAPTAGSVVLAGLLLKTGAYGFLRFLVPLFPNAASDFRAPGMVLAVLGILYGALLAFAQTDLKRLVAYTSISHMGFVLLGVFTWNELALQGAVVQMVCHGISTGALFILVGQLQERLGTRDMERMGGLWSAMPGMGGVGLLFALASLGLPGLGNFVGEFLVLTGSYRVSAPVAAVAAAGLVAAAAYSLWMIQRVFHGKEKTGPLPPDLNARETSMMAVMIVIIVWLGLYPKPVIDTAKPALDVIQKGIEFRMNEEAKIPDYKRSGGR